MKLNAVLLLLNIIAIILILSQIKLLQEIKNILQEKQTNNNLDETPVDKVTVKQHSRKAMTWVLEDTKEEGNRFYGLFGVGSDNKGNPYTGDTETNTFLP